MILILSEILSRISLLGIRLKESRLLDPTFWDPTYLYTEPLQHVSQKLERRVLREQRAENMLLGSSFQSNGVRDHLGGLLL